MDDLIIKFSFDMIFKLLGIENKIPFFYIDLNY